MKIIFWPQKHIHVAIAVQTDLSFHTALDLATPQDVKELQSQLDQTKRENDALKGVIEKLEQKVKDSSFDEAYFENNDKKVLYYTGLSTWELFHKIFLYVKPHLKLHSSLSPFQQLLVTLMRLRLNLSGQDLKLGYQFQVHSSTISRIFIYVIEVLYVKLKPLIIWPDRESLRKTMPMVFRKHYTVKNDGLK